jgi:hypothetical protein
VTHLLVIVLLIVFGPIALATALNVLVAVMRVVFWLIWFPFYAVGVWFYSIYIFPWRGFIATGGARELVRVVAICAVVTVVLMPFFPL